MRKAVFLDKDGTLIIDLPYNVDPAHITWQEGVFEALRSLSAIGYLLVIVTNQSGVARGYFEEADLAALDAAMRAEMSKKGVQLDGFYYSPYHVEGVVKKYTLQSDCRKPGSGMLMKAAEELQIDLSASWMIGDTLSDVEAGKRANCKTILISDTALKIENEPQRPDHIVRTIVEAANIITDLSSAPPRIYDTDHKHK